MPRIHVNNLPPVSEFATRHEHARIRIGKLTFETWIKRITAHKDSVLIYPRVCTTPADVYIHPTLLGNYKMGPFLLSGIPSFHRVGLP